MGGRAPGAPPLDPPMTPDPWPYIYVEVIDLPSGDVEICDIDFDIWQ